MTRQWKNKLRRHKKVKRAQNWDNNRRYSSRVPCDADKMVSRHAAPILSILDTIVPDNDLEIQSLNIYKSKGP